MNDREYDPAEIFPEPEAVRAYDLALWDIDASKYVLDEAECWPDEELNRFVKWLVNV